MLGSAHFFRVCFFIRYAGVRRAAADQCPAIKPGPIGWSFQMRRADVILAVLRNWNGDIVIL